MGYAGNNSDFGMLSTFESGWKFNLAPCFTWKYNPFPEYSSKEDVSPISKANGEVTFMGNGWEVLSWVMPSISSKRTKSPSERPCLWSSWTWTTPFSAFDTFTTIPCMGASPVKSVHSNSGPKSTNTCPNTPAVSQLINLSPSLCVISLYFVHSLNGYPTSTTTSYNLDSIRDCKEVDLSKITSVFTCGFKDFS